VPEGLRTATAEGATAETSAGASGAGGQSPLLSPVMSEKTDGAAATTGTPMPTPAPREREVAAAAAPAVRPAPEATRPAAEETRTAAAAPDSAVPADVEWWVQISSQPSRELAQASYADIASRHGSIIGGRAVNIYRADIEGKGTFYRVRIAGSSRSDATELCAKLKGAGTNCFVAR
jgi:hypothetical protein